RIINLSSNLSLDDIDAHFLKDIKCILFGTNVVINQKILDCSNIVSFQGSFIPNVTTYYCRQFKNNFRSYKHDTYYSFPNLVQFIDYTPIYDKKFSFNKNIL